MSASEEPEVGEPGYFSALFVPKYMQKYTLIAKFGICLGDEVFGILSRSAARSRAITLL
jgi:hypothetical protein